MFARFPLLRHLSVCLQYLSFLPECCTWIRMDNIFCLIATFFAPLKFNQRRSLSQKKGVQIAEYRSVDSTSLSLERTARIWYPRDRTKKIAIYRLFNCKFKYFILKWDFVPINWLRWIEFSIESEIYRSERELLDLLFLITWYYWWVLIEKVNCALWVANVCLVSENGL